MALTIEGPCPMLQVFDMPASVAFYRLLGFEVVQCAPAGQGDDFDWGLLQLGTMQLMLNTAYEKPDRPAVPDPLRTEHHADTALFFACRDLAGALVHLREHGVAASAPARAHYGMVQVWLKDPDGYVICLQWPSE